MLLSVLVICSNLAFVYAEDEIENIEEPQIEEVKKEEPQKEEVKKEVKKEEVKEEIKEEPKEEPQITNKNNTKSEPKEFINPTTQKDDLTVTIDNIIYINKTIPESSNDGKAVAYSVDKFINANGTKKVTGYDGGVKGTVPATGIGYRYKFDNNYVLVEEGDGPVFTSPDPSEAIAKINYQGNGKIVIIYKDDPQHTKTINNSNELHISPVYIPEEIWHLEFNYIDNISTGDGSWSNIDGVSEYRHTFSNPEDKSPDLTEGFYQFKYWEQEDTGDKYYEVDNEDSPKTFSYNDKSIGMKNGETKIINVYAYWQPAVKIYLHNGAEIVKTITSFDSINSADFEKLADTDTKKFLGWFDENGQLADIYNAPAITKEADSVLIIDLFAKFKEIIQPTDDPTNPVDPVDPINPIDNPKPQPKKTQPQVQPIPQTEEVVIASTNPPTTTIDPAPTPKAEPEGSWALINLIAAILSCICALVLLFVRKDTEDNEPTDDEKKDMRKMVLTKIASAIIGIGSIIIFILTENMSLPMVLTDKWTFLMILLLIIEIVSIFIIRQQSKGEENDD